VCAVRRGGYGTDVEESDQESDEEFREERPVSGTDELKNKAQEMGGRGKEATGDLTGDKDLQAEGKKDQTAGSLKQAGEKIKDAFK
jgi:uncharacterized protein YjbJ (UPF0337 family)